MNYSPEDKLSPMMLQWHACKKQAGSAILLFRLGDFYESFFEDAVTLARELEVTLTKRQEVPMAGIPFHTSEGYIDKLIAKGLKVAIAEQIESTKEAKGLVKREIVRIVTPGSVLSSSLLHARSNNFIASVSQFNQNFGVALLDLTTSEFKLFEVDSLSELTDELSKFSPKELVFSNKLEKLHRSWLTTLHDLFLFTETIVLDHYFDPEYTHDFLLQHFQISSLDSLGLEDLCSAIQAAGGLLTYIKKDLCLSIDHLNQITKQAHSYTLIDHVTTCNLELLEPIHEKQTKSTLLYLLDQTETPMGGRLLKQWITKPLMDLELIEERSQAVSCFYKKTHLLKEILPYLKQVRDLERLIMKAEASLATPRDTLSLAESLKQLPFLRSVLSQCDSPLLLSLQGSLTGLSEITEKIFQILTEAPPIRIGDGPTIAKEVNKQLDELRSILENNQNWILEYQAKLREETGIRTLKIGFTNAFGYYIEVSRGQSFKMAEHFEKRQTLSNAERFITQTLKVYEQKVLSAEEQILLIEKTIFESLRLEVTSHKKQILLAAEALAKIDILCSFATVALKHNFVLPTVTLNDSIEIKQGRHPIVEAQISNHNFIANDAFLSSQSQMIILTGPNMAGKSTFMRQIALIVILAQIGSFVPAESAQIGIVDRIFSRIGASDNLSKGHSTFMVEMTETANILRNATSRSLIILDEIGRGTSTYDGISIASAVAEHLLTTPGKQAKTLFATHYCELTELAETFPNAKNFHVAVQESEGDIVFLRQIVPGGTDKSYGIHVAKLAGLPTSTLIKAQELLKKLEKQIKKPSSKKVPKEESFTFLKAVSPQEELILQEIGKLNIDHLSPIDAFNKLINWKNKINNT